MDYREKLARMEKTAALIERSGLYKDAGIDFSKMWPAVKRGLSSIANGKTREEIINEFNKGLPADSTSEKIVKKLGDTARSWRFTNWVANKFNWGRTPMTMRKAVKDAEKAVKDMTPPGVRLDLKKLSPDLRNAVVRAAYRSQSKTRRWGEGLGWGVPTVALHATRPLIGENAVMDHPGVEAALDRAGVVGDARNDLLAATVAAGPEYAPLLKHTVSQARKSEAMNRLISEAPFAMSGPLAVPLSKTTQMMAAAAPYVWNKARGAGGWMWRATGVPGAMERNLEEEAPEDMFNPGL